jgi:hypothetical protein
VNRPLDAINFVGLAASLPLFFQFATFEQNISRAAMDRLDEAAREPKSVAWYDTGHDLNDPKVIADRDRWLDAQLAIPTIRPFLEAELGAVAQIVIRPGRPEDGTSGTAGWARRGRPCRGTTSG